MCDRRLVENRFIAGGRQPLTCAFLIAKKLLYAVKLKICRSAAILKKGPSQMQGATVIFDLDGTMVDTAPDLIRATNHVMAMAGLPAAPPEAVKHAVGSGARAMLAAAFEAAGQPLDGIAFKPLLEAFFDHYSRNIAIDSRPFPGVEDLLAKLRARGVLLGVCTNKREASARLLLKALGLDRHFRAVLGGDTLAVRKPHPGHLLETIAAAGGCRERAVMVGDSAPDIEAARAARVPSVAVRFGYSSEPVEELSPDHIIGDFSELEPILWALLEKPQSSPPSGA